MDEQMEHVLTRVSVLALRDVHTDPRVLDSLCEKRAVSYLPVTKSGVLTGFVLFKTIKNEQLFFTGEIPFLLFPGKLEQSLTVGNRKENRLRLDACICIEKQGALGRELFQGQERAWIGFVHSHLVAVCPEPGCLWQTGTGASHPLLHRTDPEACRGCGCFDNCILNLSGNKRKNLVLPCNVCLVFYL